MTVEGLPLIRSRVVPFLGVLWIEVAAYTSFGIEDVDRWQQGVQSSGKDGFAGAASTGDHHAAQARVNGSEQQGELEGAVAGDRGQGKGSGRPVVGHRYTACHHGCVQPACARQSR